MTDQEKRIAELKAKGWHEFDEKMPEVAYHSNELIYFRRINLILKEDDNEMHLGLLTYGLQKQSSTRCAYSLDIDDEEESLKYYLWKEIDY